MALSRRSRGPGSYSVCGRPSRPGAAAGREVGLIVHTHSQNFSVSDLPCVQKIHKLIFYILILQHHHSTLRRWFGWCPRRHGASGHRPPACALGRARAGTARLATDDRGLSLHATAVLAIPANWSVPLACGAGLNSQLEHATGLGGGRLRSSAGEGVPSSEAYGVGESASGV